MLRSSDAKAKQGLMAQHAPARLLATAMPARSLGGKDPTIRPPAQHAKMACTSLAASAFKPRNVQALAGQRRDPASSARCATLGHHHRRRHHLRHHHHRRRRHLLSTAVRTRNAGARRQRTTVPRARAAGIATRVRMHQAGTRKIVAAACARMVLCCTTENACRPPNARLSAGPPMGAASTDGCALAFQDPQRRPSQKSSAPARRTRRGGSASAAPTATAAPLGCTLLTA